MEAVAIFILKYNILTGYFNRKVLTLGALWYIKETWKKYSLQLLRRARRLSDGCKKASV
jgi:hypothetical protein